MKSPGVWTIRNIDGVPRECFCTINFGYSRKHPRFHHQLINEGDGFATDENGHLKTITVINKEYDPRIRRKPRKPLYCRQKPTDHCYKNHCPYFSYSEVEKEGEETNEPAPLQNHNDIDMSRAHERVRVDK